MMAGKGRFVVAQKTAPRGSGPTLLCTANFAAQRAAVLHAGVLPLHLLAGQQARFGSVDCHCKMCYAAGEWHTWETATGDCRG